jgi:hypothetical protein
LSRQIGGLLRQASDGPCTQDPGCSWVHRMMSRPPGSLSSRSLGRDRSATQSITSSGVSSRCRPALGCIVDNRNAVSSDDNAGKGHSPVRLSYNARNGCRPRPDLRGGHRRPGRDSTVISADVRRAGPMGDGVPDGAHVDVDADDPVVARALQHPAATTLATNRSPRCGLQPISPQAAC